MSLSYRNRGPSGRPRDSLAALVLVVGAIGDVVGHRRLFLTGMSLFALGAMICAIAPGIPVLIGGRGIQGAGAAMMLAAGLE
jgi:DHA2 family methylenomycin A resistance protein-like MFS transporter